MLTVPDSHIVADHTYLGHVGLPKPSYACDTDAFQRLQVFLAYPTANNRDDAALRVARGYSPFSDERLSEAQAEVLGFLISVHGQDITFEKLVEKNIVEDTPEIKARFDELWAMKDNKEAVIRW